MNLTRTQPNKALQLTGHQRIPFGVARASGIDEFVNRPWRLLIPLGIWLHARGEELVMRVLALRLTAAARRSACDGGESSGRPASR